MDDPTEHTDPNLWADPTGERRRAAIARTARNSRFTAEELAKMPLWALSEDFLPSPSTQVSGSAASTNAVPKSPQQVASSEQRSPLKLKAKDVVTSSSTTLVSPRRFSSSRIPGPPSTSRIPATSECKFNGGPSRSEIFVPPGSIAQSRQSEELISVRTRGSTNENESSYRIPLALGESQSSDVWLDAESAALVPRPSCESGIDEVCISEIELCDTSPSDSDSEENNGSMMGNLSDPGSGAVVLRNESSSQQASSSAELRSQAALSNAVSQEQPIQLSGHESKSTVVTVPTSTTEEKSSPESQTSADSELPQSSWLDVLSVDWWLQNNTSKEAPATSEGPESPPSETQIDPTPMADSKSEISPGTSADQDFGSSASSDESLVNVSMSGAECSPETNLTESTPGVLAQSIDLRSVIQTSSSSRIHQPATFSAQVSLAASGQGTDGLDEEDMLNNNADAASDTPFKPQNLQRTGQMGDEAMMSSDDEDSEKGQASGSEEETDYESDEHEHVFGVEEYDDESSSLSLIAGKRPACPGPEASNETLTNASNSQREIIITSRLLRGLNEPKAVDPRPIFRIKDQQACDSAHDHLRPARVKMEVAKESNSEPVSLAAQYMTNEAKTAAESDLNRGGSPHGSEITQCSSSLIQCSSDESVIPLRHTSDGSPTGFNATAGSDLSAVFLTKPPINFPDESKLSVNSLGDITDSSEYIAENADTPATPTQSSHEARVFAKSSAKPVMLTASEIEAGFSNVEPSESQISSNLSNELPMESLDPPIQESESNTCVKDQVSDEAEAFPFEQDALQPNLDSPSSENVGSYRQPRKQANPLRRLAPMGTSAFEKRQYQAALRQKLRARPIRTESVDEFYDAESGDDSEFVKYVQSDKGMTKMVPFEFSLGRDDEQTLIQVDIPFVIECYYEDMSFYVRIVLTSKVNQAVTYKMIPSNDQRWKVKPSDAMGIIMPGKKKLVYAYTVADYPLAYTDLVHDTFLLCSAPFVYQVAPGQEPNVARDVANFWNPKSGNSVRVIEKTRLGCNRPLLNRWFNQKPKVPDYIRSFERKWWIPSWYSPKPEPLSLKPLNNLECSTGVNAFQKDVLCGKLLNAHLFALQEHNHFNNTACIAGVLLILLILFGCFKSYNFIPKTTEPPSSSFLSWLWPWSI